MENYKFIFLCDRKACGDRCSYPTCRMTFDPNHAVNFVKREVEANTFYEEVSSEELTTLYGGDINIGLNDDDIEKIRNGERIELYNDEPEPEPEDSRWHEAEINLYYAALSGAISVDMLPKPSCRETMLIRKLLEPSYELPIFLFDSRIEMYLLDLIHGTTTMLTNVPKLDKEKYLHKAIGGMVEEMPNPNACEVNYWMNEWISNKGV